MITKYLKKILLIFLALFILFSYTLYIQLDKGSVYSSTAINLYVNKEAQSSIRGLILDRNGKVLAQNKLYFDVYYKFNFEESELVKENINSLNSAYKDKNLNISKFVGIENADKYTNSDIPVIEKLNEDELVSVSAILEEDRYEVKSYFLREYLYPELFTHTIGYVSEASQEELSETITAGEYVGKYRIEKELDRELRGTKGEVINISGQTFTSESKDGDNVYLTLDYDWQNKLYKLFEDYDNRYEAAGGAGVIIKNSTGEIFADVSYPGFDSNKFIFGINQDDYSKLEQNRDNPLLDKAINNAYTPGSIFKIFSSYTLLDEGVISPDSTYYSNRCIKLGPSDFCEFGRNFYGEMNLEKALYKSSNLFFCNYMLELEAQGKLDKFVENSKRFGIGSDFEFIFKDKSMGIMDSPDYKYSQTEDLWFPGDTCNAVIGQGAILVSPLQMARAVSIFENNGAIIQPQLVKEIRSSDAELVRSYSKIEEGKIENFNVSARDAIYTGLSSVAYSPGSAVYRFLGGLDKNVRAKTGSAETFENINGQFVERTHSWIVGTFEKDGETYSFAFMQIYGGGGYYISEMLSDFVKSI